MQIKKIIKSVTPPVLMPFLRINRYGWFGNFKTWTEAKAKCGGYDANNILNKVKTALLKVKTSEAVYERDAVIFNKIEYSWPLLSGLMWIAAQNNNKLNVLDFGGSLGSTYFQNRKFLNNLDKLQWNIIEQKNFIDCGRKYFQDDKLKFYYAIEDCLKIEKPAVMILSSALQYVEKPYELLQKILMENFEYLIIDRSGFYKQEIITIQKVPPSIYKASYPCWFFNEQRLVEFISKKYNLVADFECAGENPIYINNFKKARYKGFIFKIKK